MKQLETQKNTKGGIDMLVEKDAGNLVLVTTGKPAHSLVFWKRMKALSTEAVAELEETS